MTEETRYDAVAYPAALYPTTHPSHLVALARLHGLAAPDPTTARVLEIAGGDGVNLIAMAVALPDARFVSFDLSTRAVERGAALVRAAGLDNVSVEMGDVLEAAERMEGPFDYVIAHGLYAWVPEAVRAATLRLIGRVLSADGVAFVSYNAKPGGHLRVAIREMLLHGLEGIEAPEDRVARARALLVEFATPHAGDRPLLAAMREVAGPMARKTAASLFHDELSDVFAPQSLTEVVAAAAEHGLAFLNDAVSSMLFDGLPGAELDDAATVAAAQTSDYEALAFFHQTLLVRAGRSPRRTVDPALLASLSATTHARRIGETTFAIGEDELEVDDARAADLLATLAAASPRRLSLERVGTLEEAAAVLDLYRRDLVQLHALPFPGTIDPGERPCASPVALAQIALGATTIYTLDHRAVAFADAGPRAFLQLLDGTRDRAAIAADWAETPYSMQVAAAEAIAQLARAGMLIG